MSPVLSLVLLPFEASKVQDYGLYQCNVTVIMKTSVGRRRNLFFKEKLSIKNTDQLKWPICVYKLLIVRVYFGTVRLALALITVRFLLMPFDPLHA